MASACPGEMYTDAQGMQPHSAPRAMSEADIAHAVAEFAQAARLAIEAGFDGIELHAANGYLIEQFLNANVNQRSDGYGGSVAGRNRFALEVARACVQAIGAERVGIRLSPYGVFNSTGAYADVEAQYVALVQELSAMGLMYLHVLDHSAMGAPPVPAALKAQLRSLFAGPFILAGGFDRDSAEAALAAGQADLIAFARAFLANPDLVKRMQSGAALNAPDMTTFYTPGPKGYTDYPVLAG
jgi:N-ethylmaleimide reductase